MSSKIEIKEAKSDEEILACWPVIKELRPHVLQSQLVSRVQQQRKDEGYRLMYIADDNNVPAAFTGFRIQNYLWSGKTLYIDDLCTLASTHKKGYAGALLDWVHEYAVSQDCDSVSLDSGYTRLNAHRLYLNKGFNLSSHHFFKKLK